jgi:hypothetical protein
LLEPFLAASIWQPFWGYQWDMVWCGYIYVYIYYTCILYLYMVIYGCIWLYMVICG